MKNYTAVCRQCREYLANLIASAAVTEGVSEPAQTAESTGSQTEEQAYILKESDKSPQEEVTSFQCLLALKKLIGSRFMCYDKIVHEHHELKAAEQCFFFAFNILNSVHFAPLEHRKKILVLHLTS